MKIILLLFLVCLPLVTAEIQIISTEEQADNILNLETPDLLNFLGLRDTPSSYAGDGGKCVAVNAGETALIFQNCTNATGVGGGGISSATLNATYLLLDTSNDPLTGDLEIARGGAINTIDLNFTTDSGTGTIRYWDMFDAFIFSELVAIANSLLVYNNITATEDVTAHWFFGLFNWTTADDWNTFDGANLEFNESKLSPTYYNVTQTTIIAGIVDGGDLGDTQHQDANYDDITFNFSEVAASPGLDLRINFTGITRFNRGVMRYRTSNLKGDFPTVQLWDYIDGVWEDYPVVAKSESFATMTQPVFDDSDHIQGGVVQMRIYKPSTGNTNNHYYVDWIAIIKGYGAPSGQEVDPLFEEWLNFPILKENLNMTNNDITASHYCNETNCYTVEDFISVGIESDPIFKAENASLWAEAKNKYNATYAIWAYNQSNPIWDYNQTIPAITYTNIMAVDNNESWLSTFNATYNIWAYNQSSTYNATYNIWAYNQTSSFVDNGIISQNYYIQI